MSKIEIDQIYKIFGPNPNVALKMLHDGAGKEQILSETGHTVGLSDITLSIEEGETFVVMGLSGSGKSTLIRHLNRLIEPTAGAVRVDGTDIIGMNDKDLTAFRRRETAMVFQHFGLLPHRSVLDNVAYGLQVQGVSKEKRTGAAQNWIDRVGLTGYGEAYPSELSGGMKQRVGLARALTTNPNVLLMDEAFSALDPLIRADMQDELLALQQDLRKTIVFITHDLDEALKLGDRIAILKDGKLIQVGDPEHILLNPADGYVQNFVKDVNRGRVLTAKTIMDECCGQDKTASEDGPQVSPDTVLDELLPLSLTTPEPIAVVSRDDNVVGHVSRANVVEALNSAVPDDIAAQ